MIAQILERLAHGEPLAEICRTEGMPGVTTVWDWERGDQALSESIARAREAGGDALAAEALRIANTPIEGITVTTDGDAVRTVKEDMLGHRKLQVETRLKLLAKWHPKRYGDKLETTATVRHELVRLDPGDDAL